MQLPALRHAAFLSRQEDETLADSGARRGQGAFLILRVVDQLAGPWQENVQAFEYQRAATERYVTELGDQAHPETTCLRHIIQASAPQHPRPPLLAHLRDYAEYLEIVGALAGSNRSACTPPGAGRAG